MAARDNAIGIPADDAPSRYFPRIDPISLLPLLPKEFKAEREGSGVRLTAIDRDPVQERNGARRYVFLWARDVDGSTNDGLEAGYRRATVVGDAPAPGTEDAAASVFLVDPAYQDSGYFYCRSENAAGDQSAEYISSSLSADGTILDTTVPDDVEHWDVSESGEQANGTVYSALAYSCRAPAAVGAFAGVQLFLVDYPALGQVAEGYFHHYSGPGRGWIAGKQLYPPCRRRGQGNVTATNGFATIDGTGLLALAKADDQIEIFGVRATILSLTNTVITLTGNWTAATVTTSDWWIIGKVAVHGVSISHGGTRRSDITGAPSKSLLMDGELSAPLAPSVTGFPTGNVTRLEWQQVTGTSISHYLVFRGTGTSIAFSQCVQHGPPVRHDQNSSAANTLKVYEDSSFTTYQREQGQVFSYYVVTENIRGDQSAPSTGVNVACRLDSPADGGSSTPARFTAHTLLWNGMLSGDAGDVNAASNASVDADMGVALPAGFYRPTGSVVLAGSAPAYQNGREVLLAMTGAPGASGTSTLNFKIDGSDNTTAANRRVEKGKMVTLQCQVRHSAGDIQGALGMAIAIINNQASGVVTGATNATPIVITTSAAHGLTTGQKRVWVQDVTGNTAANGIWTITVTGATTFSLDGSAGNGAYGGGGTVWGFAGAKRRSANDVIDYDRFENLIDGARITDTHQLYWSTFYLDPAFNCDSILMRWYYFTLNWSGVNLAITEPMASLGDGLCYWSAGIDPNTTYPGNSGGFVPRGRFEDRDGEGRDVVRLP